MLPRNLIGSGRCEKDDVWAGLGRSESPVLLIPHTGEGPGHGLRSRKGCCKDQVCRPEQGRAGSTQKVAGDHTHDVLAMHGDTGQACSSKAHSRMPGRAGHRANVLAGAGCTADWLTAHRAGVTHDGLGLGGVGTEDRSGLEAPFSQKPLIPRLRHPGNEAPGIFFVAACCFSSLP